MANGKSTKKRGVTRKTSRPRLSVCMIVKNEEQLLPQCLKSVQGVADEIIVVDTGSTDRTMDIAREFGARVYEHPWQNDFSLHRNQSISYATGDWILQIDADEELAPESREELRRLIANAPEGVNGYFVVIKDFSKSGKLRVTFNYPRLFRNGNGVKYEGIVHNQVLIPGQIKYSNVVLRHYGYDLDRKTMLRKFKRSTRLLRRLHRRNPEHPTPLFYLACAYSQYGKDEKCVQYAYQTIEKLRKLESASLFHLSVYYTLVSSLIRLRRLEEAEKAALESITLKEDYLDGHYQLSLVSYMLQKFENAVKHGNKYLELLKFYRENPAIYQNLNIYSLERDHRLQFWLGVSLIATGRMQEGVATIDKAIASERRDYVIAIEAAHNLLALNYEQTGKEILKKLFVNYYKDTEFLHLLAFELASIDWFGWMESFAQEVEEDFKKHIDDPFSHLLWGDYAGASRLLNQAKSAKHSDKQNTANHHITLLMEIYDQADGNFLQNPVDHAPFYLWLYQRIREFHPAFGLLREAGEELVYIGTDSENRALSEVRVLLCLLDAYDALLYENVETFLENLQDAARILELDFPAHFEDFQQLRSLLAAFGRRADDRFMPDAAELAYVLLRMLFKDDYQVQALLLQRQIQRAPRQGRYPAWMRILARFIVSAGNPLDPLARVDKRLIRRRVKELKRAPQVCVIN